MIDGITIKFYGETAKDILACSEIPFEVVTDKDTGEVLSHQAEHRGLKITVEEPYCQHNQLEEYKLTIKGSLHKFWKGDNYSDFHMLDVMKAVRLIESYGVPIDLVDINTIEFGVNVVTYYPVRKIAKTYLTRSTKGFERMGNLGQHCSLSQYKIKVYDKGLQYRLSNNLLRFELAVTTMQYLHKREVEINKFSDLLKPAIYEALERVIIDEYKSIFKFGRLHISSLKEDQKKMFRAWRCPFWWEGINKEKGNKAYHREFKKFSKFQKKQGVHDWHLDIFKLIKEKCVELQRTSSPGNCPDIITSEGKPLEKRQGCNNHKTQLSTTTKIDPKCLITGKDISDQRSGSKFLSAKKIGYKEAHRLRNVDSNPRNNLRRRLTRTLKDSTGGLFDSKDYIVLPKEGKELLSYWKGTEYDVLSNLSVSC